MKSSDIIKSVLAAELERLRAEYRKTRDILICKALNKNECIEDDEALAELLHQLALAMSDVDADFPEGDRWLEMVPCFVLEGDKLSELCMGARKTPPIIEPTTKVIKWEVCYGTC